MFDRKIYKRNGFDVYKGNIALCIVASVILTILSGFGNSSSGGAGAESTVGDVAVNTLSSIPIVGWVIGPILALTSIALAIVLIAVSIFFSLFIINIVKVGVANFYIHADRGEYDLNYIIEPYKSGCVTNIAIVMLIKSVIIFIYSLLLFVPGIIKGLELYYVDYLLAEHPDMDFNTAFETSKRMTDGYKMDLFVMHLSFIPIYIINGITGNIGTVFTQPYLDASYAQSYLALKDGGRGDNYFEM